MPEMKIQAKFERMHELLAELEDMKKRSMKYSLIDLHTWLEKRPDELSRLADEIEYDVKDYVQTRYTEDAYEPLKLVHESREAVEREVAHAG